MIWVQFRKQEHFGFLSRRIATVCAPYSLSPPKREKESIPHVTIARVKRAQSELSVSNDLILPDLKVPSVELWSSELNPDGALYTSIASFDL
jgi:2'-5' RNA ligase